MRIGEVAERIGVTADTVRFYERAGWLPRAERRENGYREYTPNDIEHLRLLIDLRRLDLPLEEAGRIAAWCHSGHCGDASDALPGLLAQRRALVAEQIGRLRDLDGRLADLERHVRERRPAELAPERTLRVLGTTGACCDAAAAVATVAGGGCACCGPTR